MDDPLAAERDEWKNRCAHLERLLANAGYPLGHFYSPVVGVDDPHAAEAVRGRAASAPPAGVQIDAARMTEMMGRLADHHRHFPFPREKSAEYRFYFENPFFGAHDASVLFSMLLEFRP